MGRLFDEWKQKNAETGEKSVNDKACGELVHKRALLIFNPVAGEGRSLRLLPQVVKHMTDKAMPAQHLQQSTADLQPNT